jgi:hypothetical protein
MAKTLERYVRGLLKRYALQSRGSFTNFGLREDDATVPVAKALLVESYQVPSFKGTFSFGKLPSSLAFLI